MTETNTYRKITDIYCPSCSAAAEFDIITQQYHCSYCGSRVGIDEALRQKQGFRKLQQDRLKGSVKQYRLFHAECEGCGADIVFEENEALSKCPFCGRAMVRNEYLETEDFPEALIPFALNEKEAKALLADWCRHNKSKPEARKLLPLIDDLKGYYLPYEMLRGPVHLNASRMDGLRTYRCEGFINNEFINRSKQLDNLLLDGMEPFDQEALKEFDFGYLAGQRVKIADLEKDQLKKRLEEETAENYSTYIARTLETKAIDVDADVDSAIRLPVLLPVYYISDGELMAAVNGQTGKVSVRALKESHYYFLPWWLKAILSTIVFSAAVYAALRLFGMNSGSGLYISGLLAIFFIIVTLCLYSDTARNSFAVESGRKIYTSGEDTFIREQGQLKVNDRILKRRIVPPVFFEKLGGEMEPVILKFTTPLRVLKIALLCLAVLFLPVIVALFLNGFDFRRLELGGSAVWFCIFVPVVPIYLLKFGIVELHDDPWIYVLKDGKPKRYRRKLSLKIDRNVITTVLKALFIPPLSLAVWFAIISFCVMCYLTAFGFN